MTSMIRCQFRRRHIFASTLLYLFIFCMFPAVQLATHTWETETLQNRGRRQLEVNVLSIKWITHSKQTLKKKNCNLDAQTGCRCGETYKLGQIRLEVVPGRGARCYKKRHTHSQPQSSWSCAPNASFLPCAHSRSCGRVEYKQGFTPCQHALWSVGELRLRLRFPPQLILIFKHSLW